MLYTLCSYYVPDSGSYRVVRYKSQEAVYVDNVKVCGSETGTSGIHKIAVTLRIPVCLIVLTLLPQLTVLRLA